MKLRKWLLISFTAVVALATAGWFVLRVPADGFALNKSPLKYRYYSRAEIKRKPVINLSLPGGNHLTLPTPPPSRLIPLIDERPDVAGYIVFEGASKRPLWSTIQFPNFDTYRYYEMYDPSRASDKSGEVDIPVPYARSGKRRESIIQIENLWCKAILPVPPPGKEKKTVFVR